MVHRSIVLNFIGLIKNFCFIFRSKTDVPLKFNSFTVLLTDSKSHYRLKATEYQILDPTAVVNAQRMGKNKFTDDIKKLDSYLKIEPGNSYNIIFSSVPYQFIENAELQVSCFETFRNYNLFTLLIHIFSIIRFFV